MAVATPPVEKTTTLNKDEILRYSRHLILPEVGMEGQLKLKNAKVLMVGAGGLGAPLGLYLAASGVGRVGIVDFDVVDYTNLQRQVIHGTKDVGRKKLDSAADSMLDINPYMTVDKFDTAVIQVDAVPNVAKRFVDELPMPRCCRRSGNGPMSGCQRNSLR